MPTVHTNGIETHYERRGDGPPIVFVHGSLSDHAAAEGQLDAFSDTHTAIAYDLRGHGRTPNPGNRPYSVDLLADDLHALVDALDLDRPVVCGVSMGGMVAQVYASRHPEELSALVLADTVSPSFLSLRDRVERTVLLRAIRGLVRVVGYNRGKAALLWLGRKLDGGETESLRAESFPDMNTRAAANSLGAVAAFHRTVVDFANIAVPTLVLYGEHEASVVSRHAPTLATRIPDATRREVPDAGHASPWDNPEFFNDAIRAFLADAPQVTG